jgi:hypothetical protein
MDDNQPVMLDFVKAMSDPARLRIIGALSRGPLNAAQVAQAIKLPFRRTINHLAFLCHVGIVLSHGAERRQDEAYELDSLFLERLARRQLQGERLSYVPAQDADEDVRRVLAAHLNPDGSISQIPLQAAKLRVILNYIIEAFAADRIYSEREVNAILARFSEDTSGLRRDLVDAGMLGRERDGSRYWRPQPVDPMGGAHER